MRLQIKSFLAALAMVFASLPMAGAVNILSVGNIGNNTVTQYDAPSKRHLKSLELLSKLRTIPLPLVVVENLTVVQAAAAEEVEPDQTIVIGQKLHNRLEHSFENAGWN